MSQEIKLSFALTVYKSSVMLQAISKAVALSQLTMTGNGYIDSEYLVTTSATALPLGPVTTPHVAFFYNTDATNYFTIRNGSGGAVVCRYLAGEAFPMVFDPTCVPYVIANTASVRIAYAIFDA